MNELTRYELSDDPFKTFETWFMKAQEIEENAPAFTLATADKEGNPSARILLYKGLHQGQGLKFYTHAASPKGRDLAANPKASMVFYWHHCQRQVRVLGDVQRMSEEDSKAYFYSRDRESQIASLISNQSHPIDSRIELEKIFETTRLNFEGKDKIDFPSNWSGYCLNPKNFEFFVYGAHRLNDRFSYQRNSLGEWQITRLQP